MFEAHRNVIPKLRQVLDAVQQELRLLEEDLGLCAACGERRPRPLGQYATRPAVATPRPRPRQRVA